MWYANGSLAETTLVSRSHGTGVLLVPERGPAVA